MRVAIMRRFRGVSPRRFLIWRASRFLLQASFGPSEEAIAEVKRLGFEGWIDQQLAMAPRFAPSRTRPLRALCRCAGATRRMVACPLEMSGAGGELPMASSGVHDRIYVWWTPRDQGS